MILAFNIFESDSNQLVRRQSYTSVVFLILFFVLSGPRMQLGWNPISTYYAMQATSRFVLAPLLFSTVTSNRVVLCAPTLSRAKGEGASATVTIIVKGVIYCRICRGPAFAFFSQFYPFTPLLQPPDSYAQLMC